MSETKRYAAHDGARGLAVIHRADGSMHYHPYPAVLCGNEWMRLSAIKGADDLPLEPGDTLVVYRDFAMTEQWIAPPEPVEVTVGMRVLQWFHVRCVENFGMSLVDPGEPTESDLADERKLYTVTAIKDKDESGHPKFVLDRAVDVLVKHSTRHEDTSDNDSCFWGADRIEFYRCAETGRPLKLPEEQK